MPTFQTSPGFRDLLPPEADRVRRFVDVFAGVVEAAGYRYLVPPLLEDVGVFQRLGEATDVVTKEMYDFVDKGDRHVTLRPEFTAGICRAFAEHRPLTPWKVWTAGANFRYEKPQRGRYRQFDQVDLECLGVDDPHLDVEVIALGWELYRQLGLRQVTLVLNSLGEPASRRAYLELLGAYLDRRSGELSTEANETRHRNPLRVLDSKRPQDQAIIAEAPLLADSLSTEATEHFAAVLAGLDALGISYTVAPRLVRGLDYYVRTTFEYQGGTLDSAQNALGGGGRYDGLVEALGGPPTPGIGLALGVDRTLLACTDEGVFDAGAPAVQAFVVDTTGGAAALAITAELRARGVSADRAWDGRSMKAQMKAADRAGAAVTVIVGPDELDAGTVVVRPMRRDAPQTVVGRDELVAAVQAALTTPSTEEPT